jgi:hypothetical protein
MESEIMFGLLHPKLLAGEGGYYLTMMASTIHGLKSAADNHDEEDEFVSPRIHLLSYVY